jgi:hypothetical protein
MLAGHVTVGGVTSLTVTVCVQVALLPEPSVAVQMIACGPTPVNVAGSGGTLVIVGEPVQLSVAVAAGPVYVAWQDAFAFSVTFAGQEITGAITSAKVTVCVQLTLLPQSSVAVQTIL